MPSLVWILPVVWEENGDKQTNRQTDRQTHLSVLLYINIFDKNFVLVPPPLFSPTRTKKIVPPSLVESRYSTPPPGQTPRIRMIVTKINHFPLVKSNVLVNLESTHTPPPGRKDASRVPERDDVRECRAPGMTKKKLANKGFGRCSSVTDTTFCSKCRICHSTSSMAKCATQKKSRKIVAFDSLLYKKTVFHW